MRRLRGRNRQHRHGSRPLAGPPVRQRPDGQRPVGQRPVGQRPVGQRPDGQRPVGQRPVGPSDVARPLAGQDPGPWPCQAQWGLNPRPARLRGQDGVGLWRGGSDHRPGRRERHGAPARGTAQEILHPPARVWLRFAAACRLGVPLPPSREFPGASSTQNGRHRLARVFRLSWKWRERSAVKITERTRVETTEALQTRREGRLSTTKGSWSVEPFRRRPIVGVAGRRHRRHAVVPTRSGLRRDEHSNGGVKWERQLDEFLLQRELPVRFSARRRQVHRHGPANKSKGYRSTPICI